MGMYIIFGWVTLGLAVCGAISGALSPELVISVVILGEVFFMRADVQGVGKK